MIASTDAIKFDMGTEEEKERRRGVAGPAGGKGRGPAGPQKRRVAGPGAGGRQTRRTRRSQVISYSFILSLNIES